VLGQAAQGSGGVPIPGGGQITCRYGTSRHDLAGMVGMGGQLDLMILEVFSNFSDSVKQIKGHKEGQQGQSKSQAHEKGDPQMMD